MFQEGDGVVIDRIRELDVEFDIQIARLVMSLRRHTLPMDHLQVTYKTAKEDQDTSMPTRHCELTVLDDLSWLELYHQHPLVEMFDRELSAR